MNTNATFRPDPQRLYKLLPALYRIADDDHENSLGALLELVTQEADGLRAGTEQLWNDFFIETCQRWVVPYIGDLVGNIPLHDLDLSAAATTAESLFTDLAGHENLAPPAEIRTRADVAKTIYYRRRKGTPVMLEELARDVTGWGAHVVEFFQLLDWHQHLEHVRLECQGCPDLRRLAAGDRAGGPWDGTSHTVDVRAINQWNGWHNIPNVGFFLWRLQAYRLIRVQPRVIENVQWRRTFSPLGQDIPLFTSGLVDLDESQLAAEPNVEAPLRAVTFYDDLPKPPAATATPEYYGDPAGGALSLAVLSGGNVIAIDQIDSVNLRDWPPNQPAGMRIGVDVTRGRLIVPSGRAGETIEVSYYYGFSAPMGGGEYDRAKWLAPEPGLTVSGGGNNLQAAITNRAGLHTVITITDDRTYDIGADLTLAKNESLTIQADDHHRPHIRINRPAGGWQLLTAVGDAGAALTLNGLLIEGGLLVNGDLSSLRVLHSTLVPGRSVEQDTSGQPVAAPAASIVVSASTARNASLALQVAYSIVGTLRLPSHIHQLWLLDSIVDGHQLGTAVSGAADADNGPAAHIERTTLLGRSRFLKLPLASESIFSGVVLVEERQQGCVRFSFVPDRSRTPQQYLCQPAREIARRIDEKKAEAALNHTTVSTAEKDAITADVLGWLAPAFHTQEYGQPAYVQLALACPKQIRTGAADGSEMGAFCMLKQPQREANLRMRLDEYLPVGLEAGLIYVT
jgi:hypothetical protein